MNFLRALLSWLHNLRYSICVVHDLRPFGLGLLHSLPHNLNVLTLLILLWLLLCGLFSLSIGLLEDRLQVLLLGLLLLLVLGFLQMASVLDFLLVDDVFNVLGVVGGFKVC